MEMIQKNELSHDLQDYLKNFENFKKSHVNNVNYCKDQQYLIAHLENENKSLKKNEENINKQLYVLRSICKNQENSISKLHLLKEENSSLLKTNAELTKNVDDLKQQIVEIEKVADSVIQKQAQKHAEELSINERYFQEKLEELENQIELIQASSDLKIHDLQHEMKGIIDEYNMKLKEAEGNTQKLRDQILKLNSHAASNLAVYQKKAFEMEQKVKSLEKEKSLYTSSNGNFVTAQSVLNIYSGSSEVNLENTTSRLINNNQASSCSSEISATPLENDLIKRFKFKKKNMNEKINVNTQSEQVAKFFERFENCDITKGQIATGSKNCNEKSDVQYIDNLKLANNAEHTPNKEYSKPTFPLVKKRRLYTPGSNNHLDAF